MSTSEQTSVALLIPPLVPTCAGSITSADATEIGAQNFQPDQYSYYRGVLKSIIPGIVLGCLSGIALLVLVLWTSCMFCRCCCKRKRMRLEDIEAKQSLGEQFIAPGADVDAQFGIPAKMPKHKRWRLKQILIGSIILFTLGTVGVAAWGIYASVENTNTLVTNFWDIYDRILDFANQVVGLLTTTNASLEQLTSAFATIVRNADELRQAAQRNQLPGNIVDSALTQFADVRTAVSDAVDEVRSSVDTFNTSFVGGMDSFRGSLNPPTMAFENTGRFIAIAVLFGLVILISLLSGVLCVKCRHPRWTATSVILLWFFIALLMLLGVGLLQGVNYFSTDACLYSESFLVSLVLRRVQDPVLKNLATNALEYYLGDQPVVNETAGSALAQVVGPTAVQLMALLNSTSLNNTLVSIQSTLEQPGFVNVLGSETSEALQTTVEQVPVLSDQLQALDALASRQSIFPLYESIKSFICCDLSAASYDLFAAWTATGCLALVLGVLCTYRLMSCVHNNYILSS